jgi:hypothetical protein
MDALDIKNAAHWLREGATYITELHRRLDIHSTSFTDSMRVEADIIDPPAED